MNKPPTQKLANAGHALPPHSIMAGFTMIEFLVAVLVLTIGLVGLAALQMAAIKTNRTAYYRSIATVDAYDIIERMKANPVGIAAGNYNNGVPGTSLSQCETASCTPSAIAGYDLAKFNYTLATGLPNGTGVVCSASNTAPLIGNSANPTAVNCSATLVNAYVVKIWWNDDRSGSKTQGFVTEFKFAN